MIVGTRADLEFASALRAELVKRGFEVWNPERDLAPGGNWLKESGRALERADGIVFLLSDRALESPAIQKEIDYALTTGSDREGRRAHPVDPQRARHRASHAIESSRDRGQDRASSR